jgi:hypothetical protein
MWKVSLRETSLAPSAFLRWLYAEAANVPQIGHDVSQNSDPVEQKITRARDSASGSNETSKADAAAMFNVSPRTVQDSRTVLAAASPEVIARVERGELAVSKAAREIREATPRPGRGSKRANSR